MRGLLAGVAGGIVASLVNIVLVFVFNIGELVFWDFAGVIIFGRIPKGFWEHAFAELGHLGFSGAMGVAFAYLIPAISSDYYLVKGLFFGLGTWFFIYSLAVLFHVPYVRVVSLGTAIGDYIASAVFGLVMAKFLRYLDVKV